MIVRRLRFHPWPEQRSCIDHGDYPLKIPSQSQSCHSILHGEVRCLEYRMLNSLVALRMNQTSRIWPVLHAPCSVANTFSSIDRYLDRILASAVRMRKTIVMHGSSLHRFAHLSRCDFVALCLANPFKRGMDRYIYSLHFPFEDDTILTHDLLFLRKSTTHHGNLNQLCKTCKHRAID